MPFVMIVLVIEEIIPLIVLYVPGMLPSTCVLPSQRERIEKKRREKQETISHAMKSELRALSVTTEANMMLKNLTSTQLIALCGCAVLLFYFE